MSDLSLWVVSRNATNRPTLMHAVDAYSDHTSVCGVEIGSWSRHFLTAPLPFVGCKRCLKITGFAVPKAGHITHLRSVS